MKNVLKMALLVGFCFGEVYAAIPNDTRPTTFLGPSLSTSYTDLYNSYTGYSFLGEIGRKNARIGFTVGWSLNNHLKISAEYLWQKINYSFFSENTYTWVQQGAVGALFQHPFLCTPWEPSLDVAAYYSRGLNKTLGNITGVFLDEGIITPFDNLRRISGSKAGGIAPGVTIHPIIGTSLGVDLNYDVVRYDTKYIPNHDIRGIGGTIRFSQAIRDNFMLRLTAAYRQPFNSYTGSLKWLNLSYCGIGVWTFDIDGAYTVGKTSLPNTWNFGLSAHFSWDAPNGRYANGGPAIIADDLLAWTSIPAVYMPQAIVLPDEDVVIPAV